VIPEGQTEVMYALNANGNAEARQWHLAVIGESDAGSGQCLAGSGLIPVRVAAPYLAMKIEMAAIEQGKAGEIICKIEQTHAFEGKARVILQGLRAMAETVPLEITRDQTEIPTADEQPLYYLDWVLGNIEKVDKASGGKIGYVHVPDMGVPGLNEFAKFYYPQLHKEALVVDCRGNGGGNVSPMIIERLRREPAMWTVARNGAVNVDPSGQVLGPKVLLIDQHSASDGDIVGYRFRKHRLGSIIGQRSWGGVVGIRGSLPLLDGGILNRPEFSRFDLEAKEWIMEGTGVEPDIEVDNDPTREFSGTDDQLNRAIAELKKAMEAKPVRIPQPPAYPDKSK
jgi:C-terminal processing protease CtpA/Prc